MSEEEIISQEEMEAAEEQVEDSMTESVEDSFMTSKDIADSYGSPEAEKQYNQHTFLAGSITLDSPEKVTYFNESELGRPLFSVRFLLDMEDILKYYLDDMCKDYGVVNRLADYFRKKIDNVSSSGMSNQGFIQNLNATKRVDITRKRVKNNIANLKGGKQDGNK